MLRPARESQDRVICSCRTILGVAPHRAGTLPSCFHTVGCSIFLFPALGVLTLLYHFALCPPSCAAQGDPLAPDITQVICMRMRDRRERAGVGKVR